jgi:hypothetical protein
MVGVNKRTFYYALKKMYQLGATKENHRYDYTAFIEKIKQYTTAP